MMHRMDDDEFYGWMAYYDILADEVKAREEEAKAEQEALEAKYNNK
jgi:hypothetical protein